MNNKGFTLIEILACLVIISIVSISIGVGVDNMLKNRLKDNINEYKETVENAACTYIDLASNKNLLNTCRKNSNCNIKVSDLILSGLVADNLENPETKEYVNPNSLVTISWDSSGLKTCKFER